MSSTTVKGVGSMMQCKGKTSPPGMILLKFGQASPSTSTLSSKGLSSVGSMPPTHRPTAARWPEDDEVSRQAASKAASSRGRDKIPMQGLPAGPSRIGKKVPWLSERALRTEATEASGGNMASSGNGSHNPSAASESSSCGASPSKNGKFFRTICSSSWPLSFSLQFTAMDTATPSMTTGASLKSLTHSTTMSTEASVICLKPQSMAADPTMA
mmetsp:Transcript_3757/g.9089  ORF Transcript_3757/g.9089 Transcript_3757/m.9089 type:complete len:213 (-) Transcript_3757:304-942(-)